MNITVANQQVIVYNVSVKEYGKAPNGEKSLFGAF